jgi:hypothetical protein
MPTKNQLFTKFSFTNYLGTVGTVFKDKKSLGSHKTLKIKVLLNFLFVDGSICSNKYKSRSGSLRPKKGFSKSGPGYGTLEKLNKTKKQTKNYRRSLL